MTNELTRLVLNHKNAIIYFQDIINMRQLLSCINWDIAVLWILHRKHRLLQELFSSHLVLVCSIQHK